MGHTAVIGYMEILQLRQSLIRDYTCKIQRKLLTAASLAASATPLDCKVANKCILLPTWFLGVGVPVKSTETAQSTRCSLLCSLEHHWISIFILGVKATGLSGSQIRAWEDSVQRCP